MQQESTNTEVKLIQDHYPVHERAIAQILTWGSLLFTPLFSYFLFVACKQISGDMLSQVNLENSSVAATTFSVVITVLIIMNLVSDSTAVNPVEEAEDALSIIHNRTQLEKIPYLMSKHAYARLNQLIAFPSFMILGAADAVAVAYIFSNKVVQLSVGIPVTFLNAIYYYMFSGHNIRKHAYVTINQITQCFPSLKNLYLSPLRFIETHFQVLCNVIYRSVAAGYIAYELLETVFHASLTTPFNKWSIITLMLATAYVTYQSRFLQVYNHYFRDEFLRISSDVFQKTKVPAINIVKNLLLSSLRGIPASILLYNRSIFNNSYVTYIFSTIIGGLILLASFIANHQTDKLISASLKQAPAITDLNAVINDEESSASLFHKIAKQYQNSTIKNATAVMNIGARAVRWIAFIGFLATLNMFLQANGMPLSITFTDLLLLSCIWGIPTLVADYKVFQEEFIETWSYYRTKIQIGATSVQMREFSTLLRGITAFFTSKKYYEPAVLHDLLNEDERPFFSQPTKF